MTDKPKDAARALADAHGACRTCKGLTRNPNAYGCPQEKMHAKLDTAVSAARKEALEEAAQEADKTRGGFTANIRTDESEQELVRDPDGPWVLNHDIAIKIRALKRRSG